MGSFNAANGDGALSVNVTGTDNTASGFQALTNNTTGNENIAVGFEALGFNLTGSYNVGIGAYSGYPADGSYLTGSYNTALANGVMFGTGSLTNATAIGANAEASMSNTMVLGCIAGVNGCQN